jgi:polygalacturonase
MVSKAIIVIVVCLVQSVSAAVREPATYGAKGDGVTDDAPALQRCIDAAKPFDHIVFPKTKTYLIRQC